LYLSAQLLPNFFVAGAPKAGTTSLYRYLDQHPGIYMSPIKEPHFLPGRFESRILLMKRDGRRCPGWPGCRITLTAL
jgi:hypothetical protein